MRPLHLVLILAVAALVFAPITGYIAASHGRSFRRWFALGLVLPFVSVFVALFVAMRAQLAEEKAARGPKPPSET
ncbi:hypothetical protein [Hymenobacter sp.]|uniref:hypothetical protein n=1 Tax=Hymenobacter sp. TaxID=1898978 RepID=UPI00286C3D89|nr:hypothetical protein [Hymenobacter sp.]